jgi:hypothetical protein
VAVPFGSASRHFISQEAWEDVCDKEMIFIMVHHQWYSWRCHVVSQKAACDAMVCVPKKKKRAEMSPTAQPHAERVPSTDFMRPAEKPIAITAISRDCVHLELQHEPVMRNGSHTRLNFGTHFHPFPQIRIKLHNDVKRISLVRWCVAHDTVPYLL